MTRSSSPGTAYPSLAAVLVTAVLAGCSFTPELQRPGLPVADVYPGARMGDQTAGQAAADLPWQEFVHDGALRELVQLALDNNRDLRVAVQRIEQARAQYQIRQADQFPTVGVEAAGNRSEPNPMRAFGGSRVNSSYTVGLGTAAWELDFFGRVRALRDVALADFLATTEARKAAQISLIAGVITTWLQLNTDTELLALTERTLVTREQTLRLMKLRFDKGASSGLDLRQAESLVAAAKAARAEQQRLRAQDLNLLTQLAGTTLPADLVPALPTRQAPQPRRDGAQMVADIAPVTELPSLASVPAGLPSELLLRRPDVRAAEQQLIGANANIGAARANYFPRITLTGSFGRVSTDLDGLFGAGGQKAWSFGPSISLPIFDAGRRRSGVEAAEAGRKIAVAEYEKTIQAAFREVADALAGRSTLLDQLHALQAQVDAERDRLRLADLSYRQGVASFLDLLDAQRSLFAVEQAQAQVRLAQRAAEVQLYKTLGGGWTEPSPGSESGG